MSPVPSARVHSGFLLLEVERKRVGANVFSKVWAEAGGGELKLWDDAMPGNGPATARGGPDAVSLLGLLVGPTRAKQRNQAHTIKVGEGEAKKVFAVSTAEDEDAWTACLRANAALSECSAEERARLVQVDRGVVADIEKKEQVATLCRVLRLWCGCCDSRTVAADEEEEAAAAAGTASPDAARKPASKYFSPGRGLSQKYAQVQGAAEETALAPVPGLTLKVTHVADTRRPIRATYAKLSAITGWLEVGERVTVIEQRAAEGASGGDPSTDISQF